MRTLSPAPTSFLEPTGDPAFGSYTGVLPPIDLGAPRLARMLRRKKWFYVAATSSEVWISIAIVRMGYATSAFAFVYDLVSRRMLADRTLVGPPGTAEVADDAHGTGQLARIGLGRSKITLERDAAGKLELRGAVGDIKIDVILDESSAPPAIAAIARLGPGLVSATEKRVLAPATGRVFAGGRTLSLDGAVGGYDYTHGLMPRNTRWKWAFAMGRAKDGEPIAFNVVEGFVGEAECAAFRAGAIHPIREPRFTFDVEHPERSWRLQADGMDLTFDVGAVHAQRTNLLLVRSRFLQPVGTFRGTIRIGDRDVEVEGLPGVVEDQDVLW